MASAIAPLVDCCLEEYRTALKECLSNQNLFVMPEPKFVVLPDGELARVQVSRKADEEEDVKEEGQIDDDDDEDGEETENQNGEVQQPLTIQDIQAFLIALLLPEPRLSTPPKWCRVLRCMRATKVGIFFIKNNDLTWLDQHPCKFNHMFKFQTTPDWMEALINIPLSRRQQTKGTSFNHQSIQKSSADPPTNGIPRTSLLLNPIQMITERFPIPHLDDNVVYFNSRFEEVTDRSRMFSIDCEMCLTTAEKSELTRISIVDEEYIVVYDTLVKPANKITDYLTKYSGITKEILDPIDTTLEDVLRDIRIFLPKDAIICGHSLNNDLQALNVFHPYIIDTSIIYNLTGCRPLKPSLKSLAYTFLEREIQTNRKKGHDSIEDAATAMELVKLKLARGLSFGDQVIKDAEAGVKYDVKTGMAHIPINKFVSRHNFSLAFCEIDMTPNARFLYIYDEDQPVSEQIKESIFQLMETKLAVCVVLTDTGLCYIKF